jgi:N-acetylneuraminic acid mutarotase
MTGFSLRRIAPAVSLLTVFLIPLFAGTNSWTSLPDMSTPRANQTATLLQDGRVLLAGGGTATAEIFDPSTGSWTPAGSMSTSRAQHTATLLQDGRVLVTGGCGGIRCTSAEIYDPASNTWQVTASMNDPRWGHVAALLPDGHVLVAGGGCVNQCSSGSFLTSLNTAEIYDPVSASWTMTASMRVGRQEATATVLEDGTVLVAGGFYGCDDSMCTDNKSAERYDPVAGDWSDAGLMHVARAWHRAVMLANGDVLVVGGAKKEAPTDI